MGALSGKVAIVTGASKGMGRSMARTLVDAGAKLALLARPSAELQHAAQELGAAALAVPCDVADPDQVRKAFRQVIDAFGQLDILVNNAAICEPHLVEKSSDQQIRNEIAINLIGPIFCAREAIPYLRAGTGSNIVNVSTESVRLPFPYLAIYAASKGGLETFSAGLRGELRADRIRVTTLRVGNVGGTSIIDSWSDQIKAEYFPVVQQSGHLALTGGFAKPESVARALLDILLLPDDLNVDLIEVRSR
ncbi:MAG: short-chain dehydrogenase/reductase [Nevskia sp.]|nr:short-chain dehydrogenase/reductase [Nevskia sp.]